MLTLQNLEVNNAPLQKKVYFLSKNYQMKNFTKTKESL